MESKKYTFENFVTGNGLLNSTLVIWVVFLMHTYTRILWRVAPKAEQFESFLHVIESVALGLVTFLIIRRARNVFVKLLFAMYEFLAVMLYYNEALNYLLTYYLALLCASSIFGLGYISNQSYKDKLAKEGEGQQKVNEEVERLTNLLTQAILELTSTQSLVSKGNTELTSKEKEVTSLQDKVSELSQAVTILNNGVTTREAQLQHDLQQVIAQNEAQTAYFETYKAQATEWERVYHIHQNRYAKASATLKNKTAPTEEKETV